MKDKTLNSSLLVSSLLHAALILLASSALSQKGTLPRQDFLPIRLIELPRAEKEITAPKAVAKPPPSKVVKTTDANSARSKTHELKRSVPATAATLPKEEPANRVEAKPVLPNLFEQTPVVPPTAAREGGGSEAGAADLFGNGDLPPLAEREQPLAAVAARLRGWEEASEHRAFRLQDRFC